MADSRGDGETERWSSWILQPGFGSRAKKWVSGCCLRGYLVLSQTPSYGLSDKERRAQRSMDLSEGKRGVTARECSM